MVGPAKDGVEPVFLDVLACACPAGVGMGWKQFYQAALDLMFHCSAKLTREEIIDILHEIRWRFGTASKRNAQVVVDKILADKSGKAA